ncbi:M23 family metallopeptidase [Flavobacterium sp. ASW18X]|nr:M23 family metallopeptidase [Flavobacterium sp. ASW18X]
MNDKLHLENFTGHGPNHRRYLRYCLILALFLALCSCKQMTSLSDAITQPSAREVYERNYSLENKAYAAWQNAFANALNDSVIINLPYKQVGKFSSVEPTVLSFSLALKEGERLVVSLQTDSITSSFLSLYKYDESKKMDLLLENKPNASSLSYIIKESGMYKLVLQPQLFANTEYTLLIRRRPTYYFPVSGKDNSAVQSFWGAPRAGGARQHEGIDIFAARGTPVVAATDGRVVSTRNQGLGGKQVWLADGLFGNRLYYAHLDSIIASAGQKVTIGDTLGLVGNTGNAKTTAPHLHFGIYKSKAVDPYPFVKKIEPLPSFELNNPTTGGIIKAAKANVRQGNSVKSTKLKTLKEQDIVQILGYTKNWVHVRDQNGTAGYVYKNLLQ